MPRKALALVALSVLLLSQRPSAEALAKIYFVDIGQGAGTLIVSPTGKTLLVDGGPDGNGNGPASKLQALMTTLGIATIDYTIVTHYHIDHVSGVTELINANKVTGIAYDNGDGADVQPPGTSTSASSTRGHYLNYIAAIAAHPQVTRAVATPGTMIDLGGGMRATIMAAGGHLLSGGSVQITNGDLNSESISTLIEYGTFDYLVSGDLTGGGSTSTAKTPDVETYVGQMVGDVDVVQLDHHGSTTANNPVFLAALKAEVAVAQASEDNTFGHANRETINKYLNTPATNGNTFPATGIPTPGLGPVAYQHESNNATDDRVSTQLVTSAAPGHGGQGTILLTTDGTSSYSLTSFDDGGTRLNAAANTYAIDGAGAGITTNFPPTVVPTSSPAVPLATDAVTINAAVNDREDPISAVTLNYAVNGASQAPVSMSLAGGQYQASIPAQPDGARVDYAVTATAGTQTTTYAGGYFSGTTPISSLRALNAKGEPLYFNYAARIQGLVTASGYSSGTNDDYVQDATAAINVYRSSDTPTPFTSTTPGQIVSATGRIGFLGGRERFDLTESVEKTTSPYGVTVVGGGPAPTPEDRTIAELNANPESFEGRLVRINNASVVSGSFPASPQPLDSFVVVSDGTGSFVIKLDHDTNADGFVPAASPFTVVGIIQQDDFLRPFDSSYDITPRNQADIGGAVVVPPPLITIGEARVDAVDNVSGNPPADFVPDRLNQVVRVQGAITSIDFRGGNGIEYYIQDATGGIDLFSTSLNAGPFTIGQQVEAQGAVTQFNGLTELTVTLVSALGPVAAPAPFVLTLAQIADGGLGEAYEGQLIQVNNVTITAGLFPASNASGNVTINDGTAIGTLRVDSDTNIDGTATPGNTFTLIGLLGQFDTASPFDSGYQILPRSLDDLVGAGGSGPALAATPATLDFGSLNVGGATSSMVTLTNNAASAITLNAPSITGAGANQFQAGAPGTTTLAASASTTLQVTFLPTSAGTKNASLTITGDPTGSATVSLTGIGTTAGGGGNSILISEIRFRGPLGGNDEFVELYNNSDNAVDISGWKLMGSSNTAPTGTRATVPAGVILPGRAHYLFVNNTAVTGYSGAVPGNTTYTTGFGDNGGAAITLPSNTIVDQLGITTTGTAYREGNPIATQLTTNTDRGYERKPGGAALTLQDTDDNTSDFQLTTPSNPQNIVLTAAPSSVNFGVVPPGNASSLTVAIKNLLASSVTLNGPAISGAGGTYFTAGPFGTTTLAAGASTMLSVTFQPLASGAQSASLDITSSASGTVTIPLSGSGAGGLSVTPSPLDFGQVSPGATANATLTITNTDTTPTVLTPPFSITGPNAADFAVGAPATTTLAGNASTSVSVAFQPTAPGGKSATLTVTSSSGSRQVALTGAANCPAITLAGTLPNAGLGQLYLGSITASGGAEPHTFTQSGGTLPPGLGLNANGSVTGTPTALGPFSFNALATASNGCTGTALFTITVVQPVVITVAPGSLDFGVVPVSTTSLAQLITITNVTAFPVTLATPFSVTGSGAANFAAGLPATTTLVGGASTTAAVTFTPAASGVKTATLDVLSSGGGSGSVSLAGAGSVQTPVVISGFRTRGPGTGNDEFVEIYNNTDAPIDISGWKLNGSSNTAPTGTRATVGAGVILPPRTHYLFVNTGAYSGAAPGNTGYATGISDNGGVALVRADPDNTIADQVGVQTIGGGYREGMPLATLLTTNVDRAYERKPGHGAVSFQDTDDNSTDFVLVAPSAPSSLGMTTSPSSVDFGSVAIASSASQSVTVKNNFIIAVTLASPAVTGADASAFAAATPATSTLPGGTTAAVGVTFAPMSPGFKSAALTLSSTTGGTTTTPLAGLAVCAPIAVNGTLPGGQVGVPFLATITATGGIGSYTFSSTGTAPPGLTLAPDGTLSGTPTAGGTFTFAAVATTPDGCSGSANITIAIAKGTATLTWNAPAPIVYGTALGAPQLNATVNAPGTIVYNPPAGTVLNAGNGQTLTASFVPTNPADYDTPTATTSINVTKASLSATANNAAREFGSANPTFTGTLTGVVNGDGITASFVSPATPASAPGTYPIIPALTDPKGRLGNYDVTLTNGTLTIVDTTAPSTPVLSVTPSVMSPPNHKMVEVKVTALSTDAASSVVCTISGITSNEPDNGVADGDTANDIGPIGGLSATLRAERSSNGNGRVYTITVACHDASGNTSAANIAVAVPKDAPKGK